jgi:uncharacterized protein involved in outer membrane biogenesis
MPRSRGLNILKWTGIVLGVLIVALILVISLLDWNRLRGPISRYASAHLHRAVAINGDLKVHLWSWTPSVSLDGLTIGNPEWEARKSMLEVDRIAVQLKLLTLLKGDIVLPLVDIEKPVIYLHRGADGKANWQFDTAEGAPETRDSNPVKLPVVRRFMVNHGAIKVLDEIRKLKFDGSVQAREKSENELTKPFELDGKGELNDKPFSLKVAGGPLINLDPKDPYNFSGSIQAADTRLDVEGQLPKPFDLGVATATLKLSGKDLADLYYITSLALPNTPRYQLAIHLERQNTLFRLKEIKGIVGSSDMSGDLSIETGGERPRLQGALTSKLLDFADLAAPLGTPVTTQQSANTQGKTQTAAQESKVTIPPDAPLLPDSSLQVSRVRAMDADVRYDAQAVNAGKMPLKKVSVRIKLDAGVLAIDPFAFEFPQGKLSGTARIDARQDVPQTDLDVRLTDLRFDQFIPVKQGSESPLNGTMQARAKIHGSGDSIHALASSANGNITAVVPRGEMRAAFAELTGINVLRALGLLISKDQARADVRCGIADFKLEDGVAHAQNLVFDTENVLITGGGQIRMKPEELDLTIEGKPKKIRLMRLHAPIELHGHLRKPSVGLDAKKPLVQAGIATALGAVFAPLAAVVAFVDPGLAKDSDCAALFAEARDNGASTQEKTAPAHTAATKPSAPSAAAKPKS